MTACPGLLRTGHVGIMNLPHTRNLDFRWKANVQYESYIYICINTTDPLRLLNKGMVEFFLKFKFQDTRQRLILKVVFLKMTSGIYCASTSVHTGIYLKDAFENSHFKLRMVNIIVFGIESGKLGLTYVNVLQDCVSNHQKCRELSV